MAVKAQGHHLLPCLARLLENALRALNAYLALKYLRSLVQK